MSTASVRQGRHTAHHVLTTNSLTPWFQTHLDVERSTLAVDAPRSILGVVPAGRRRTVLDLRDVTGLEVGWRIFPDRLVAAALLVWLAVDAGPPLAIGVGAAAVWLAVLSYVAVLRIGVRDRGPLVMPICVFQRGRARRVADRIAWIADHDG